LSASCHAVCAKILNTMDDVRVSVFPPAQPAYLRVPQGRGGAEEEIKPVRRPAQSQTMDREGLSELVDFAVDGLDSASLVEHQPKTDMLGGGTYSSPASLRTGSFSVASESLREVHNGSADVHRAEEARLVPLLTVVSSDKDAAAQENGSPTEWHIVDAAWWRAWCAFVKGGPRPGSIRNAALLADGGHALWAGLSPGENYVGMTAQSFGLLSELYGADLDICLAQGRFSDAPRHQLTVTLCVKR